MTTTEPLHDRVRVSANELTKLCKILTACGPDEDVDGLTAEHKADIEDNLVAVAQEILDVLRLAGLDVKGAVDCLADVADAMAGA